MALGDKLAGSFWEFAIFAFSIAATVSTAFLWYYARAATTVRARQRVAGSPFGLVAPLRQELRASSS